MKLALEHVNAVQKTLGSGKKVTYYYHRKTGKRILGEPGTLAFYASYQEAGKADEIETGETLSTILLTYLNSPEFKKLSPRTQREYARFIQAIREKFGRVPLSAFNDKKMRGKILEWRDEIATSTLSQAELMVAVFRTFLSFAERRGVLDLNILARVGSIYAADRSEFVWEPEQVSALFAVSAQELRWAIELALLTGQRISDLIEWEWSDWVKGVLRLQQNKSWNYAPLPIEMDGALKAFLGKLPRSSETILTRASGKPWTYTTLNYAFVRARRKAGLEETGLHFHDLRGTAITVLADQGCTEAQIAAMTGHSLETISRILRRYLKRTTTQAGAAMRGIDRSWIGQLQTGLPTEQPNH